MTDWVERDADILERKRLENAERALVDKWLGYLGDPPSPLSLEEFARADGRWE